MADRSRYRVGREGSFFLLDVEADSQGVPRGHTIHATVGQVNTDNTLHLRTVDADGDGTPRQDIGVSHVKGYCSLHAGLAGSRP
jgi:hypothetical protein